jgi:hypothetical protein
MRSRPSEKPNWIEPLEETLLLAISLFILLTWIAMLGVFTH